jgi:hypothetical protein
MQNEKNKNIKVLDGGQLLLTVTDKEQTLTSRLRGRPKETRQQISDRINIWSHSPNPHTNLLNAFIQIANNKGTL